jgi:lipopolysaccharide export system permease protein
LVQTLVYCALRQVLFDVKTDLAATLVREGEFTQPVPGLTVYAQTIDNTGEMHNIFIHQTKEDGTATTYIANTGRVVQRAGGPVLLLHDESTQRFSPRGVLNFLTTPEYPFELSQLNDPDELIHYKSSDRFLHELFYPDLQQAWEKRNRKSMLAEGNARIATPLYNIAFMALALSAIIGGAFSRLGYGRRIAIVSATAVVVRILGFVAQSAADGAVWVNVLQYLIPIATTVFALRSVFRQRASRFIDMRRRRPLIAPVPA